MKRVMTFLRALCLGFLLMTTMHAHAAWLYACDADLAPDEHLAATVVRPDGHRIRIGVIQQRPPVACTQQRLPFPLSAVAALRPVPPEIAQASADRFIVTGSTTERGFMISTVAPAARPEQPRRNAMPFDTNLLPQLTLRPYGIEERAQARLDGEKLVVTCAAGQKPAGVILGQDWYIPGANARLLMRGRSTAAFALQASDAQLAAQESAVPLGMLDARDTQSWRYALQNARFDLPSWRTFSISCPDTAATLSLDSLVLQPEAGPVPARATWIWNASAWQKEPDAVLNLAMHHAIRTLFISIPVAEGRVQQPSALSAFIRRASAQGIAIWSVDGDPAMVLPDEQAAAAARVAAYRAYNDGVDSDLRLAGAQFDVEPYLLPGYDLAEPEWDDRYVALVRSIRQAGGTLPIEMVIPYWWADKQSLLQSIAPDITGLTVMDYRTSAAEILRFGAPFLDWGRRHGKRIRIALEAGPVDKETVRYYTRAEKGQLSFTTIAGTTVGLITHQPHAAWSGTTYALASSNELDGTATSFYRDTASLVRMLSELEAGFSVWPSFGGLALHEMK